jgi:uncharacterized protein (DUF2235 family)
VAHFMRGDEIPEKLSACRCRNAGLSRPSKRIILLSDGTGNSAGRVWRANVWRTFESLDLTSSQQIAFYDDGVGTSSFKPFAVLGRRLRVRPETVRAGYLHDAGRRDRQCGKFHRHARRSSNRRVFETDVQPTKHGELYVYWSKPVSGFWLGLFHDVNTETAKVRVVRIPNR